MAQFKAAQEMYVTQRTDKFIECLSKPRAGQSFKYLAAMPWPAQINREAERAANYTIFARSKNRQAIGRSKIRQLSSSGPLDTRSFLKSLRIAIPQAMREIGEIDIIFLSRYVAEREFVWSFLRKEALGIRKINSNIISAKVLAANYMFLGLSEKQIERGIEKGRNQAIIDAAENFPRILRGLYKMHPRLGLTDQTKKEIHLNPNSIRSLLSKLRR